MSEAGRELDALVAEKVMGLTVNRRDGGPWHLVNAPYQVRGRCCGSGLPGFSTDIAAAWEVVERLRWDDWMVAVFAIHKGNLQACAITRGSAAPYPPRDTILHPTYWQESFREQAETAPLAICLAALKAVGVEVSV